MIVEFKFSNGDRVEEKISGFKGIVTGSVSYITGCNQHLVTAKSKDENSDSERVWFDEGRLSLLEKEVIKPVDVEGAKKGSDLSAPTK